VTGRRVLGVGFAALAAIALGGASRVPWTASPESHALLRLSWRAPSVIAEQCRALTEAEKAELPVHMRVPEVCETHAIPYVLEATIDGAPVAADTIHGAGAREDRPVIVFREIPVAVGTRAVEIAFRPVVPLDGDGDDREEEEEEEEEGEHDHDGEAEDLDGDEGDDGAVALAYAETFRLGPREVALLTLDAERLALIRVVPTAR
jgi:hypothetical protein